MSKANTLTKRLNGRLSKVLEELAVILKGDQSPELARQCLDDIAVLLQGYERFMDIPMSEAVGEPQTTIKLSTDS